LTKIRSRKSINLIEKAWKFIAINFDHEDLVITNKNLEQLNSNNNKQVTINGASLDRLNNLTTITDQIFKKITTNNLIRVEIALNINNKIN